MKSDPIATQLAETLRPRMSDQDEAAALERIRADIDARIAGTRRPSRRVRRRAIVIAVGFAVVVSGVAGAASSDVRGLLDFSGPAKDRISGLRGSGVEVTPHPSVFGDPASEELIRPQTYKLLNLDANDPLVRESVRVLMDHEEGEIVVRAYGATTQAGRVCFMFVGTLAGGGSCFDEFSAAEPVKVIASDNGSGAAVYGLAADEISSVRILMSDGASHAATMGPNSFYWGEQPATGTPVGVEATLVGGRVVPVPITEGAPR